MTAPTLPYAGLAPLFVLLGGALAILLLGALLPLLERWMGWLAALVVVVAGVLLVLRPSLGADGTGTLGVGSSAYGAFGLLVLLGALGAVLLAIPYLARQDFVRGEFFALVLFSASGGLLVAAARDLVFLFVALEILTVPLYVLAGFWRHRRTSIEASLKYFLVGVFSSAFLLYGIALYYGATGTLDLAEGAATLSADAALQSSPLLRISLALIVVGIGFKVAAVPFHFWAPDVYQGAPTPVTAYLAVASKAGGFAFGWRVLTLGFAPAVEVWSGLLAWMAGATLVVGALLALLQEDVKRLLAYSSVAHAGYALIALVAQGRLASGGGAAVGGQGPTGTEALLFYLLVYAVTATGAFTMVCLVEKSYGGPLRIRDYAGMAQRHPVKAAALALFLLSLAGIPPAGGFVAKYVLFWSAIRSGAWSVAIVGALTAVVGLYYYLSVVVAMYFQTGGEDDPLEGERTHPAVTLLLGGSALGVLVLGVWPGPILAALRAFLG